MAKRILKFFISDILDAANKIEKYVESIEDFDDFKNNEEKIDAIVRNFEIIGEAANNIPKEIKLKYPDINWRDMVTMRNILSHEYFQVALQVVWDTIKEDIPNIKLLMEHILKDLEDK